MSARVVALALALAGCEATDDGTDTDTDLPPICTGAVTSRVLAGGFDGGTEGLTFSEDGTLYVVGEDALVRVSPEGTVTEVAPMSGGVGATWWNDAVWVASWSGGTEGGPALVEVTPDGTATVHDTEIDKPNFLTPTPWGTLLVADDFVTTIYEVTADGDTTTWAGDVPSPNGMAFTPDGGTLYVASTFVDAGLSAIEVEDQAAVGRTVLTTFDAGTTPDGIALAPDGEVLVALNLAGRLDAWTPDGVTTFADGLDTPASLAFGQGPFDPCSVVVTQLFGTDVVILER